MAIKAAVNLGNGVVVPTSTGALATIPTTVDRVQLSEALIVNTGTVTRTVDIYVLQSGGSVGVSTRVVSQKQISADESYLLLELIGMSIESGGSIQGTVDAGSDVHFFATCTEFTTG